MLITFIKIIHFKLVNSKTICIFVVLKAIKVGSTLKAQQYRKVDFFDISNKVM